MLHTILEIPAILAGILTQISLWPINLKIMGRANVPVSRTKDLKLIETVFIKVQNISGNISPKIKFNQTEAALFVGILVAVVIAVVMYWFFGTEFGSAIRATGDNEDMIRALGVNTKITKLFALAMSNGLVGLSGALVAQSQKYGDINMGTGAIVIGLAAIVIGEVLMGWAKSFGSKLASVVLGSVCYFVIRAVVLAFNIDPSYMKLISAVIIALALSIPIMLEKSRIRRQYAPADMTQNGSNTAENAAAATGTAETDKEES